MIANPYFDALGKELQSAYVDCVAALRSGRDRVPCNLTKAPSQEEFELFSEAISFGNPGLLLSQRFSISNGEFVFEFISSGSELAQRNSDMLREVERISAIILRDCHTDVEKVERLNSYLCRRVGGENHQSKTNGTAYGALIERKARCEGFAKAAALICDRIGLECMIVAGKAEKDGATVSHAWNIVRVGRDYYHFDFAWNASITKKMVQGVLYLFNNDDLIHEDHHELEGVSFPRCPKDDLLFTMRHKGEVTYGYQAEEAEVVETKVDSFTALRFHFPIESEEINAFIRGSLSPYSKGDYYDYYFDCHRAMLQVYFLHND